MAFLFGCPAGAKFNPNWTKSVMERKSQA